MYICDDCKREIGLEEAMRVDSNGEVWNFTEEEAEQSMTEKDYFNKIICEECCSSSSNSITTLEVVTSIRRTCIEVRKYNDLSNEKLLGELDKYKDVLLNDLSCLIYNTGRSCDIVLNGTSLLIYGNEKIFSGGRSSELDLIILSFCLTYDRLPFNKIVFSGNSQLDYSTCLEFNQVYEGFYKAIII